MTPVPSPPEAGRHVTVVGAGAAAHAAAAELRAAGVTDVQIVADARDCAFDDATDTWRLRTAAGETVRSRIVIAANQPPFTAWIPELPGRSDFRGISFHAARWDPDFDPAGKHIAVVGPDSAAGHHMSQLTQSAASVTVFAHAPRRIVPELPSATTRARRWLHRRLRPAAARPAPRLALSPIARVTASGVRTSDGVDHGADAIVYGTGFAVPASVAEETLVGAGGVTIGRAWEDGMEPYFGIAVHGFPNYFFLAGPDHRAQARYVAECVRALQRTSGTRIEVRRSSQRVFNERACLCPAAAAFKAFDLNSERSDDRVTYDGEATLTVAGVYHPVRARLTGRLDPIDGQYHWQGTVSALPTQPLPDQALRQSRTVTLRVGGRDASARIVEKTPWGTHSVAGIGTPPYAAG
ncbi:hypothetical protein MSAS_24500 [Mycobacterium saskatchewanense]|uniref:Monooxygenase n=1 Tax=Mycobacterium saskatchewanense TaxID=220927 RepID=A0AAJ3NQ38_9MYCO|nr:monooxygenase [Mycobacterium saskatchewanense]BBX63276.1 hypothetical protein MSAS_24500 [Mycobacterium saskatchewanense]